MPVSGTIPTFNTSLVVDPGGSVVVSVSGAVSGVATGVVSTEPIQDFYTRAIGILSLSGVLATSGAVSGMQCLSGTVLSGLRNLQQELAMRVADIEQPVGNTGRLARANLQLTAATEVLFGS
jgi:propanediol dehydratase large subunit